MKPLKTLKNKADKMWSLRIRERDKKSVLSGKEEGLQACHIFSRHNSSTRWHLDNGITLTKGEHYFWAHKEIVEFVEFVKKHLGIERYEALRIRARQLVKVDRGYLESVIIDLTP